MTHIQTCNPATETPLQTYALMSKSTYLKRVEQAEAARAQWLKVPLPQKCDLFQKVIALLSQHEQAYATCITQEMGKPISQALNEVRKCTTLCAYYAEQAETLLAPEFIQTNYQKSYKTFEPIGLILGIMPWNFPFWQVFRFLVPNILLGNGILLKHAPNVTGCALMIEGLMKEAGFPEGLFSTLVIDVAEVPTLIHHPLIQGITLTGSQATGRAVAQEAGLALKKVVLELGGNDPYLILDDADLDLAVRTCVQSRLNNAGQVCIAAKRLLVSSKHYEHFIHLITASIKTYQPGDPLHPLTQLGPMARDDLRQNVHTQVTRTIKAGASCLQGGHLPHTKGYYYPATLLTDVPARSPAFTEEIFGPVFCLTPFDTLDQAISLANQSLFGLGSAIFTQSIEQAEKIAPFLQTGTCAINTLVSSHPKLPFGGIKQSGFGRELSVEGTREFANVKTVVVS